MKRKARSARSRLSAKADRARALPKRLRSQRFRFGVRRLIRKELSWEVPRNLRRPRYWLRGFLSASAVVYDLDRNRKSMSLYVTDAQRYLRSKHMVHAQLQDLLDNKLAFHNLLIAAGLEKAKVPLVGVYVRGAVHRFPDEDRQPLEAFLADLPVSERLFLKPLRGAEGKNLFAVERTAAGYDLNRIAMDAAELRRTIEECKRPLIVEQAVVQHPDLDRLFPYSVNTIRILTMLDMRTRSPFIARAVQRIGTERSAPVDNWTQGGLSACIDPDSGVMSRAAQMPTSADLVWHTAHPESGQPIEGVVAPHWPEIRDVVLRAARSMSFMEYVGWDVIVAEEGPVILEANINSGLNVLQVHGPLMVDERVRRYLRKRGVV